MRLPRTGGLSRDTDPRQQVRREVRAWLERVAEHSAGSLPEEHPAQFPPETLPIAPLVLVACSGGPDSLALAAAVAAVAPQLAHRAGAVIVDHGLQPGSDRVAADAAAACRALGLAPVEVIAVTPGREGGPESAARDARHAALLSAADRHGARAILLGHTRDDQAETVLLRLARGSGARSLAGMAPLTTRVTAAGREVRWLRPLLTVDREVVRRAARADGLAPWTDPHNLDPAYARARVRHEVLPGLVAALGSGVVGGLARSADLLREDADALDAWATQALEAAVAAAGGGEVADRAPTQVYLDPQVLRPLPIAVRTRVLRQAALRAGASAGALTADHVRAIDALVSDWRGQGEVALPGARAWRRHGTLGLSPTREPLDRT